MGRLIFMALTRIPGLQSSNMSYRFRDGAVQIGGWRNTGYGFGEGNNCPTQIQVAAAGKIYLRCVRPGAFILLDLPMRFHDLFGLHGGKLLGDDLQRHSLDVPRLWSHPKFWK